MRKLSPDPDALAVESFGTETRLAVRGTVRGAGAMGDTGVYGCRNSCRCPSHHDTGCC